MADENVVDEDVSYTLFFFNFLSTRAIITNQVLIGVCS
jgi:hypothetical protein